MELACGGSVLRRTLSTALLTGCTLMPVVALGMASGGRADQHAEIARLITQLGSDDHDRRQQAERGLVEIGSAAIPALRAVLEHPDPEVRLRANRAYRKLTTLAPGSAKQLRQEGQQAFGRGDYEAMARAYAQLARTVDAKTDDLLWLGHAHQLAGRWAEAVAPYLKALKATDRELKDVNVEEPKWGNRLTDRARLVLLIGRIQRDELGDNEAAAKTFAKATDLLPPLARPLKAMADDYLPRIGQMASRQVQPHDLRAKYGITYECQALRELALTQERLGRHADAIQTWSRTNLVQLFYGRMEGQFDPVAMERLVRALPADRALPFTPTLILLSPETPGIQLDMTAPASLARAYYVYQVRHWRFAAVPPPGQEFETVTFGLDLEQLKLRYGGQFRCWVQAVGDEAGQVSLGGIGWPAGNAPGREVITRRCNVPAGAGLVHFEVRQWPGCFRSHTLTVQATFRPRRHATLRAKPGVWMQNEVLPKGGRLLFDGKPMSAESAYTNLKPGRHTYSYSVPGRTERVEGEMTLVAGARYGLFANLASPFRGQVTNLRHFGESHVTGARSLARLPDGRWLVAHRGPKARIHLSTSRDLVTWAKPWTLPCASLSNQDAPSLYVGRDGVIWLAYFSDRIHLPRASGGEYRLWLAHSGDARRWSRPRPIAGASFNVGNARSVVQMLGAGDGRFHLFWQGLGASGASPGDVTTLRRLDLHAPPRGHIRNPHVTVGPAGQWHVVFDSFGTALYHATSADGRTWRDPVKLLGEEGQASARVPQLILGGNRVALFFDRKASGFMCRGRLGKGLVLGPPIKITHHVIPMNGSRVHVTPDGDAVFLAGADTVWLYRAKLADVLGQ